MSESQKTIFITSFHPHISRNILQTRAFEILQQTSNLRIVLIVPEYKRDYFQQEFGKDNVLVEGVVPYQASKTFRGLFFKRMGIFLFNTKTATLRKRYQHYHNRKHLQFVFSLVMGCAGRLFWFRRIMRWLDMSLSPKGFFKKIFNEYKPHLVFSTDIQNENDISVMQAARIRGVPIIGMLRSWDNVTQRIIRVLPDKLFVGSQALFDEVVELYRYPREKTVITGNPHYDIYRKGPTSSKENFFKEWGFDPYKKTILYAPVGNILININDIDQHVMEVLGTVDANILVRFPPDEDIRFINFQKPARMKFDRPGVVFKSGEFGDREIRKSDDERLVNSIFWSDLVITGPTSICLDAAFFDKPVIAVNFYPKPRNFYDSVWSYKCNHIQKLLATGGVKYTESKEEFLGAIQAYFKDPKQDAAGRAMIRSLWFSHADGKAGDHIANVILQCIRLK